MRRNITNSGLSVVCLCVIFLFIFGCNNNQQISLKQKPEANRQVVLSCRSIEHEQVAGAFFEAYPENWEY